MASASKHIANWHAYERGIEALAHSLGSHNVHDRSNRKGLTFEDLLIKVSHFAEKLVDKLSDLQPIQRVCKYPLLFADLYKHTPVIDGPESRAEVEKVLCRLRETTQEINKATNDYQTRARIQRSWLLQDLLISPDSVSRSSIGSPLDWPQLTAEADCAAITTPSRSSYFMWSTVCRLPVSIRDAW